MCDYVALWRTDDRSRVYPASAQQSCDLKEQSAGLEMNGWYENTSLCDLISTDGKEKKKKRAPLKFFLPLPSLALEF